MSNQKNILLQFAQKNHFLNPVCFVDDGYSGTDFDRPGFQEMLSEIEAGRVSTVIVKDLSRFGRNSALTGMYTNITFAKYGVRFIAVNDNYDTIDPNSVDNDFAGLRNWFNEFYARDTSRKIRAVQKAKGERSIPLTTNVPYGYVKDPNNPKRWLIDPENPYGWEKGSIVNILERREYTGCTVNFKTYTAPFWTRPFGKIRWRNRPYFTEPMRPSSGRRYLTGCRSFAGTVSA